MASDPDTAKNDITTRACSVGMLRQRAAGECTTQRDPIRRTLRSYLDVA
jgi:hypothetical protein